MARELRTAFLVLIALTGLTGIAYPLLVTGLAQLCFPRQADGSLLELGGRSVGSAWIGQPFDDPGYFWSRPSATAGFAYNGAASAGSNLGPTSDALRDAVRARIEALRGVRYRALPASALLRHHLLRYGVGGIFAPFFGIKAIDLALVALGLA